MKKPLSKNSATGNILPFVAFLFIVTAFFALTIGQLMPNGALSIDISQLADYDLSQNYYKVSEGSMDQYPAALYTPNDFENGTVTEQPHPGIAAARYGTAYGRLPLTPGVTYGITGSTAAYSQKLWIDGKLMLTSGTVTDSADTFVPSMRYFTIYFTATNEYTELVTQYALFNHVRGGFPFFIGQAEVIEEQNRRQYLYDGIVTGSLLAIGIFLVGMFLFYRTKRSFLFLALACISVAIHYLIFDHKNIMVMFPNLDWYVGHKIEYFMNIGYYVFVMLFAYAMLNIKLPKWLNWLTKIGVGLVLLFYLVMPSSVYTRFNIPIMISLALIMITVYIYMFIYAIKHKEYKNLENVIALITVFLISAAGILNLLNYIPHQVYTQPYVTLLCAFMNSIALVQSFTKTEKQLKIAQQKENEVEENNRILSKMDELRTNLLHEISHEMKTPLTVMSGYAQLTNWQLAQNATNKDTMNNLNTISSEAQRLSALVSRLLEVSFEQQEHLEKRRVEVNKLFEGTVAVCKAILEKNKNEVIIDCNGCPDILANQEMLLQVLINLIINANKHTFNGQVLLTAKLNKDDPTSVLFMVKDTGSGISAEDRDHVFDRGFSRDDSSGLGLPICQDVIKMHGGMITLAQPTIGAEIIFTIPKFTEE